MADIPYHIGDTISSKGQDYLLVGFRAVILKNGASVPSAILRSLCAQCGEPFEFAQFLSKIDGPKNRRCQTHKRPGQRVRKHRKA